MRGSLLLALLGTALLAPPAMASGGGHHDGGGLRKIDHFVVIYEENHSFDNLYGGWERVNGLHDADVAHTRQVNQAGAPYDCLLQNDVNLTSPPLEARCANTAPAFSSHFFNEPFRIEDYISPEDTTCPKPGVFAPMGVPKARVSRAAARATSCTASTRSSTSSTAAGRTATSPAPTPSA